MIYEVFTVYDSKARAFHTPFYVSHIDVGIRTFHDAVNEPKHPLNNHPEDYTLFHIGQYNDENAVLLPLPQMKNLGLASNYLKGKTNVQRA